MDGLRSSNLNLMVSTAGVAALLCVTVTSIYLTRREMQGIKPAFRRAALIRPISGTASTPWSRIVT